MGNESEDFTRAVERKKVTVQVEIRIYCVFRMKKIIYSVLSPSPKRRICMGLERNATRS